MVDGLLDPAPPLEHALLREQQDRQLHAALRELSDAQREIVMLRDFLDLSYAEIAEVLELAQGTVMSRLHRARQELKRRLNHVIE